MAFIAKNLTVTNQPQSTVTPPSSENELDLGELEYLLKLISNADLKGHQVEMFYRMALKLQTQYLQKQNK
jgi:hypothetical protein